MAISTKSRLYSDPSYGSYKVLSFGGAGITAGTRATALVDRFVAMNPITVLDWSLVNTTLGTGGSSQWSISVTSANGTAALATAVFVGTHGIGGNVQGSVASVVSCTLATGGTLDLYSILSTAAGLTIRVDVLYKDAYDATDN